MAALHFFGESLSDGEEKYAWIVKKKIKPSQQNKNCKATSILGQYLKIIPLGANIGIAIV